jgi:glycosyltransferase involved in cell wall biosynthesis
LLRGASIVCIASIDWDFNRQNPQETAFAFSNAGNRVLYIENTGVRAVGWRDTPRLLSRLANWWRARGGTKHTADGVDVLSPLLLPLPFTKSAGAINARLLLRSIRRGLRDNRGGPLIVITFLPTPLALAVIEALDPALVVYYCIDRLVESSPGARKLVHSESRLMAEADLVLVTSGTLYEAAAPLASRVELLASGVWFDAYDLAWRARSEPHPAFEGLTGAVIGFVGTLRNSTDIDLLAEAAALAPDLNFVLAGPHMTNVKSLERLKNVRLTGAIPYAAVMNYVVRFDVGVLPYVLSPFTTGIMPVKLKEYLAAGLPIVATPLPEVLSFAAEHSGIITFADDAAAFVSAVRAAIAENSPDAIAKRLEIAKQFDWSRQMMRMNALIEDALARDSEDSRMR